MRRIIDLLAILVLTGLPLFAQEPGRAEARKQEVRLGRGMSIIAPGLIQVAQETRFFLLLADKVDLTDEQRTTLADIAYAFQTLSVQRLADLKVADAELERLLTRESIDLGAVRAKVKVSEDILADIKIRKIEAILKAINTLTHEQHLKIVTLFQELPAIKPAPQAERVYE